MTAEFLLTGLVFFFAAFTQGMTGFGFAMVSLTMLSFLMNINEAVPLAALCGLVVNIYLLLKLKEHMHFFEIKNLIIGSVIGIPFGSYVLSIASAGVLEFILGFVILLFVFLSVTKVVKQTGLHEKWGYVFGLFSGLLGGSLNTNGPPVLIYFYLHGFDKLKQKASITGYFFWTSLIIVATHTITGAITKPIFTDFLATLPFVIAGFLLGDFLFGKVTTGLYNKIILAFLFVMSLIMIFR